MIGTCIYLNCRNKKNVLKNTDLDNNLDLSQPVTNDVELQLSKMRYDYCHVLVLTFVFDGVVA